jgi:hypothetical protein
MSGGEQRLRRMVCILLQNSMVLAIACVVHIVSTDNEVIGMSPH